MANSLFETTYNPDVLTCLANLSNDEVFTPPTVVNDMLDMLPQEIFSDPKAKFLDPVCKSGVFLREIAKRLIKGLEDAIPNLQERLDHIFKEQLYGIAITELTSSLTRRSLYCSKWASGKYSVVKFKSIQGNIRYKSLEHRFQSGKCVYCGASEKTFGLKVRPAGTESHAYELIHTIKPEDIWNMKFDVIVGNPPYQLNDGGGTGSSAVPIYHRFVESAIKLSPRYMTMIMPSRWFTGGKGLDDFRAEMIKDRHLSVLHDFVNARDCFPGVSIEGGVCYFLYDRSHNGPCSITVHQQDGNTDRSLRYLDGNGKFDIFIRDESVLKIVETVLAHKCESFATLVSPRNPFGVGNKAKFVTNCAGVKRVFGRFNNARGYRYLSDSDIKKGTQYFGRYKLFASKADGAAGQIGNPIPARILGKPVIGEPNDICTETFLAIGPFASVVEAQNVKCYMQTKFFRFLAGARKNKNMTQDTYLFVPIVDFSKEWTDEELYTLFGLSNDQRDYVERMITELDDATVDDSDDDAGDE